jgi:ubiquinone/menaquinone biosynthesis C-methylase UbiE
VRYQLRIVAQAKAWGAESVADIGCGTGSLLSLFKESGAEIAGIDISPKMIEQAKRRLGEEADLRVADSEHLPWGDGSFSLVVCVGSFHHYPAPLEAPSEMRRVLMGGGHLIIADPTLPTVVRQLANLFIGMSGEGATRMYSEAELGSLIREAGFGQVSRIETDQVP